MIKELKTIHDKYRICLENGCKSAIFGASKERSFGPG